MNTTTHCDKPEGACYHAPASWSAAALCRFSPDESARGQAQSKTSRFIERVCSISPLSTSLLVLSGLLLLTACNRTDLQPDIQATSHHEITHQYLSAHQAHTELDWQPTSDLHQGLQRTINWYRARLSNSNGPDAIG